MGMQNPCNYRSPVGNSFFENTFGRLSGFEGLSEVKQYDAKENLQIPNISHLCAGNDFA